MRGVLTWTGSYALGNKICSSQVKSRRSWKYGWVKEGLEKEEVELSIPGLYPLLKVDLIHSCQVCLVKEVGEIREPPGWDGKKQGETGQGVRKGKMKGD